MICARRLQEACQHSNYYRFVLSFRCVCMVQINCFSISEGVTKYKNSQLLVLFFFFFFNSNTVYCNCLNKNGFSFELCYYQVLNIHIFSHAPWV